MEGVRILIVEDDPLVLKGFETILKGEGYDVTSVTSGEEALDIITEDRFHLILTDLMLGEIDGLNVLRKTKEISPNTVVVMITGYESMESAIKSLRDGAYDYLIKPCKDIDLKMSIKRALEKWTLEKELLKLERLMAITQTAVTANHEVNSPLQAILMSVELLLAKKENLDEESKNRLKVILDETLKIRDIVKRLTKITEPVTTDYIGNTKMFDLHRSNSFKIE